MSDREQYRIMIDHDKEFVIDSIIEKNYELTRQDVKIEEQEEEIERLNNITKNINKILKDDDLCHVEKLQEIHKLVGSDKE